MSSRAVFSPKLLLGFVGLAIGTFVLSLYLVSREQSGFDDLGPTTFSRSALGYTGIADVLTTLGVTVVKSQNNSAEKAKDGLLILAEPRLKPKPDDTLETLLEAPKVLVVLPKWQGLRSRSHAGWLEIVREVSTTNAQYVLDRVLGNAEVLRAKPVANWPVNTLKHTPAITEQVQLVKSASLTPLVSSDQGILLGEFRLGHRQIWVLSDPDVLANHGLGADGKRNAVFAVELINMLRGGGKVVFDETIHGFISRPDSPWRFIFQFPFIIVTLQAAAAIALLLWATMGRFGPPDSEAPPLAAGKHGLIDNVARLMAFAGYQKLVVRRYVEATIRDVGRQLHAPKDFSEADLAKWAARIGEARGATVDSVEVLHRAENLMRSDGRDLSSAAEIARDIYRWKGEIIDGPSGHPRDH